MKKTKGNYAATCEGKERMGAQRAKIAARNIRQRGEAVTRYRCPFCGKWHVGASNRNLGRIKT